MAINNAINFGPVLVTQPWTPVLQFDGDSTGITYTTQRGSFTRVGDLVFYNLFLFLSSKGAHGASTLASVSGLPFDALTGDSFASPNQTDQITGNIGPWC